MAYKAQQEPRCVDEGRRSPEYTLPSVVVLVPEARDMVPGHDNNDYTARKIYKVEPSRELLGLLDGLIDNYCPQVCNQQSLIQYISLKGSSRTML